MKVGDLIVTKYDAERGIHCVGVITEMDKFANVKVHWITESTNDAPTKQLHSTHGWWQETKLKKFE